MMKFRKSIFLFAIILMISCNKEGAGCFDKAGDIKTTVVEVDEFTHIDVNSNVDVLLLNDGPDRVEITAGENLIPGISLVVEKGVLKIENLNTCFWSTGYTHPLVTIRNATLEKVIQHGYGKIYSKDTLSVNRLSLQIEDASGSFDLIMDASTIDIVTNSLGPITLKGKTSRLSVGHYYSDGILYAKELQVGLCFIQHFGSNRMELNVKDDLTGRMESLGNVYLYGQRPPNVDVDITGDGRIIEMYN